MSPRANQGKAVAILTSGGVESAALVSEALTIYSRVYPIYVREGLRWEAAELRFLTRLLSGWKVDGLAKLTVLDFPVAPLLGAHWSLQKKRVPGFTAPDAAVYLPGRNLCLLALGGLFCSVRRIPVLWIGILKGNPFHDARSGFLRQMEKLFEEAVGFPLGITAPFREWAKSEVIHRYPFVAWEKTFSCLRPVGARHCGRCQKCAERQKGFGKAGILDPTEYAR